MIWMEFTIPGESTLELSSLDLDLGEVDELA